MLQPILTALPLLFVTLCLIFAGWIIHKFSFWKNRGLVTPKIHIIWGNYREAIQKKKSYSETLHEFYRFFKFMPAPHGGVYIFLSPVYVPVDPAIIKRILRTDFDHFAERGFYVNQEEDPLSAHLFTHDEHKWRHLRPKFTPMFGPAKLKMMYETLFKCTDTLEEALDDYVGKNVDVLELIRKFTLKVIASCVYGVEYSGFEEPDEGFYYGTFGSAYPEATTFEKMKMYLTEFFPNLSKKLNLSAFNPIAVKFYRELTKEKMEYRERYNIIRKDFMHLLIQLKNSGKLIDTEDVGDIKKTANVDEISFDDLVGQAFSFYKGGTHTPCNTICFALCELAVHREMQVRCRREISDVMEKHEGKLTYEALSELHYLECVINETMRMYPPFHALHRICTKDYHVPGTSLVLRKGQKILIPILGIHRDKKYFTDPDTFKPLRFSGRNSKIKYPAHFMPFGLGPKSCIGQRFAMMEMKLAVTTIINNYEISRSQTTKYPVEFGIGHPLVLSPKEEMWLELQRIR